MPAVTRAVVRTAEIDVRVRDAASAADRAAALATMVLRVPPAQVLPTLTQLAALGRETNRKVVDQDVTEQAVDLESLQARSQALGAQVDLATITVHLQGEGVALSGHEDKAGFTDGLSGGWQALLAVGRRQPSL